SDGPGTPAGSCSAALPSCTSSHIALRIANATARPMPRIQVKYHIASSLSVDSVALLQLVERDPTAHDAVDPGGVEQDQRQEDDRCREHQPKRVMAGRRVP